MYDHAGIALIIVAKKVPGHCCIVIVFDVINMTLESVNQICQDVNSLLASVLSIRT